MRENQFNEPWEFEWDDDNAVIFNSQGVVATIDPTACDFIDIDTEDESMPYIERAIVCVNHCAGLTDTEIAEMRKLWDSRGQE